MKFGENSPYDNALLSQTDRRAKEYYAKIEAERVARAEEALLRLRTKLGIKADQSIRDFLGLSPSNTLQPSSEPLELDPDIAGAIDDLFTGIWHSYRGGEDQKEIAKNDTEKVDENGAKRT